MAYRIKVITVIAFTFSFLPMVAIAAGLTDGLVGYWPLDGNGKDESGSGHDVTLEAGANWVDNGWINGAMEVDGSGGHAVVDSSFNLVTTEITVIARINGWKTIDWSGVVVGRSDTTLWMGVADNDTLTYVWNNNSGETWGWIGAPAFPQDKWALIAIAIAEDKATSYIYDRASGKLESADNVIPHIEQTVINLKFGWDDCCGDRYFNGIIDEVMIYDRTLSADEITMLATDGLPVESKGKLPCFCPMNVENHTNYERTQTHTRIENKTPQKVAQNLDGPFKEKGNKNYDLYRFFRYQRCLENAGA